jgi:phosphate transport system substrate-binding protein
LAAVLAACGQPAATPEPILLRASGSTTMQSLAVELGAAYSQVSPTVSFEVEGGGSGFGIQALRDQRADLGLASWLPPTLTADLKVTAVARDAIAIIVHRSNTVDGLGLMRLQALFSGRVDHWWQPVDQESEVLVQPISREDGSGTRSSFEELVMGDQPVTPRALVVTSSAAVIEYVAEHPEAIGYVTIGSVTPEVKVLVLEGQTPTSSSASLGSYPLTRELWLVYLASGPEAVEGFVRFVLSPAGQQVVGRTFGRIGE